MPPAGKLANYAAEALYERMGLTGDPHVDRDAVLKQIEKAVTEAEKLGLLEVVSVEHALGDIGLGNESVYQYQLTPAGRMALGWQKESPLSGLFQ